MTPPSLLPNADITPPSLLASHVLKPGKFAKESKDSKRIPSAKMPKYDKRGGGVKEIKMFYTYILKSKKTDKCYIGWTTNVNRRLWEHNKGLVTSTKNRGPYKVIYYEAYSHKDEAITRELSLKRHPNVLKQLKKRLFKTLEKASSKTKEVVG